MDTALNISEIHRCCHTTHGEMECCKLGISKLGNGDARRAWPGSKLHEREPGSRVLKLATPVLNHGRLCTRIKLSVAYILLALIPFVSIKRDSKNVRARTHKQ